MLYLTRLFKTVLGSCAKVCAFWPLHVSRHRDYSRLNHVLVQYLMSCSPFIHPHTMNIQTWSMSALRGRKYTMLSDISLARRKISNVSTVKNENQYLILTQWKLYIWIWKLLLNMVIWYGPHSAPRMSVCSVMSHRTLLHHCSKVRSKKKKKIFRGV